MSDKIYLVDGKRLTALKPAAPPDEDRLQELIAEHSDLIGEEDGDLLLVRREQGISDSEEGAARWSLDHLFVTRDAMPVLVEVKRAVDTRLRREVIGQLLDYAAHGARHWSAVQAEASFRSTCENAGADPEERLAQFLAGGTLEPNDFWQQMETRLRAGDMKLLIVADRIPSELARIVEFLNTQMRAEIYAVELRYFTSDEGLLTLVPRAIGRTEETKARGSSAAALPPISVQEWLDKWFRDPASAKRRGAEAWVEVFGRLCDGFAVSKSHYVLSVILNDRSGKAVRPANLWESGDSTFFFNSAYIMGAFASDEAGRNFFERYGSAVTLKGKANPKGEPLFSTSELAEPETRARFEEVAEEWVSLWRAALRR